LPVDDLKELISRDENFYKNNKAFSKKVFITRWQRKTGSTPVFLQNNFENSNYLLPEPPPPPKLKMADRANQLIVPSLEIPL
jgi:hypothetical protein